MGRQRQPRPLPPSRRTGRAGRAVGQLAEIKEFPSAQVGQQVGQRPTRRLDQSASPSSNAPLTT